MSASVPTTAQTALQNGGAEVLLLALWNWVADAACLAAVIHATGAPIPWHTWLLAYGIGVTSANLALTPGGIGFIEVALATALFVNPLAVAID